MQICSRQICAGTQIPGKACKHYIHGVWIPAIRAGMTLLLKHLYNQETEWYELIDNTSEVGISAIRCFEIARLEKHNRVTLPLPRNIWFEKALDGSGIS